MFSEVRVQVEGRVQIECDRGYRNKSGGLSVFVLAPLPGGSTSIVCLRRGGLDPTRSGRVLPETKASGVWGGLAVRGLLGKKWFGCPRGPDQTSRGLISDENATTNPQDMDIRDIS